MANTAYKKKKEYKILAIIHTLEKNIHLYLHVQYLNTVRFFFVIKRTIFIFRHKKIVYAQKKPKKIKIKKTKNMNFIFIHGTYSQKELQIFIFINRKKSNKVQCVWIFQLSN